MTPEELREFEKTGKALNRLKGGEVLFDEDYTGRMKYACWAMNGDTASLHKLIGDVRAEEDGLRNIVRALNNVKSIGHAGALCFTQMLFEAAEPTFEDESRHRKFLQLLDSVTDGLRTGMGWLSEKAAAYLTDAAFSRDQKTAVWIHWCAAMLRSCSDAGLFIDTVGAARPKNLQKSMISALNDACTDEKVSWDIRSAAVYLMLGNHLISLENAQAYAEEAYAAFPLEALEGVEILSIAVENDAALLAEYDVIQEKLAQIRRENLILKNMTPDAFADASMRVFESLADLPDAPVDAALCLQTLAKPQRIITTAFIDDTRRSEWIAMAAKNPAVLRSLAAVFFAHFAPENPLVRTFGIDLASALLDNCSVDARLAARWIENSELENIAGLREDLNNWIEMLK